MNLTLNEAKEECERWFAYLKREEDKSLALQKLAADRRQGTCDDAEMRRRRDEIMGPGVTVYDGGNLEAAVRTLLRAVPSKRGL